MLSIISTPGWVIILPIAAEVVLITISLLAERAI